MVLKWLLRGGLEVWLVARLLDSRMFHRMVGSVHRGVERLSNRTPPPPSPPPRGAEHDLSESGLNKFVKYFKEEIRDQMKGKPPPKH
ncbi:hypothetical protein BO71DRAFT_431107 [Aspergillus ellipticus CBS 707.79]|uniref:Uncharacterized protein n=1 Tax=Aspergillus ellipticus CBS 707.79 TaxID=1448320 RepID=A0A319DPP9_9EURO|nr:hypothetical protein BO71DRAFT_431107 [Aspergillus ellipticus CBS 707.79]